jgi:hypothetical protein
VTTLTVSPLRRRDEQQSSFKGTRITISFSYFKGKTEIIPIEYDGFTYARIVFEFHFWSGIWQTYRNPCLSASAFVGTTLLHMRGGGA